MRAPFLKFLGRFTVVIAAITITTNIAAAATFLWSTNNATYGLLQGTVAFTVLSDPTTSHCGGPSCYLLQLDVSNTSSNPANQSSQILEGIFFNLVNSGGANINVATGMLSATATLGTISTTGTTVTANSAGTDICAAGVSTQGTSRVPLCTTVPKGWQNAYSTSGFTVGGAAYIQNYAIGDAGWGLFQGGSVGNPTNGLAPVAGIASSPNATITKNYPFVYESGTFVLYGLNSNAFTVTDVVAAYGTAPEAAASALNQTGEAPEPGTAVLITACVAFLPLVRRISTRRSDRR